MSVLELRTILQRVHGQFCRGYEVRLLWRTIIWLFVGLAPAISAAAEPLTRSVLIIDQSGPGLPFYAAISSAIRTTISTASATPVSIYVEQLELIVVRMAEEIAA